MDDNRSYLFCQSLYDVLVHECVSHRCSFAFFFFILFYLGTATKTVVRYSELRTHCSFFTTPLRFRIERLPLQII